MIGREIRRIALTGTPSGICAGESGVKVIRMTQKQAHQEFELNIPGFLKDQLSNDELEKFLDHYDSCRECRDELSIRYLIETGLTRLETGESFNLQKELNVYVKTQRSRLIRRQHFVQMTMIYELVTIAAFAAAVTAAVVLRLF